MIKTPFDNNFILGFISCVFMFSLMGLSSVRSRYGSESDILNEFNNIYSNMQSRQFNVLTSTPVYSNIREGELILVNSGGVVNLVTRIGNTVKNLTVN